MTHCFGELWTVRLGDREEVRLVVTGDFRHMSYGDNVLTAFVAEADMAHALTAFVVDVGGGQAAMADRVSTVTAVRLRSKAGGLPGTAPAAVRGTLAAVCGLTG